MSIHQDWYAVSDVLATDLIKALYQDAGHETDPERAEQIRRDAAALEDIWTRSKYALAPTRDQMTAALGNASLNIADTLSELAREMRSVRDDVSGMHLDVQSNNTLVSAFLETVPPQINQALGGVKAELTSLNSNFSALGEKVDHALIVQAEHTKRLDTHDKHLRGHDDQLLAVNLRIDAAETRITANEAAQRALEAAHQSLEREHRRLVSSLSKDARLLEILNKESGGGE